MTFQFELPNGFLSEAVGVFERWDEGAETYFVRRKDGEVVRVPARGVRFGKLVETARRRGPRRERPELPSAFIRRRLGRRTLTTAATWWPARSSSRSSAT